MSHRSSIRDFFEYSIAVFILKTLELGPRSLSEQLARGCTRLLDLALPRLRRVALQNLAMALPELSGRERERIISGVFRSIARLLVAFARFPQIHRENVSQWIRYEGYEHFEEALKTGRGVLFATAHLGNWELSAFAHALLAAPMDIMVRALDNPKIDALVENRRALSGNRLIKKRDSARAILKALQANRSVGILIDQNTSPDQGIFVDFFGIPACSSVGFAKLAAHSGAAVIPGFALWSEQEERYVLRFYPAVSISGDAEEDTRRLQKQIEAVIREYPDQWLWIHRRWKTRPPGETPLY